MVCGGRRHSSSHRKEYRSLVIGQAYSGRTGRTSGLPSVGVELTSLLITPNFYEYFQQQYIYMVADRAL